MRRIWWQSSRKLDNPGLETYNRYLLEHLESVKSEDTEIHIHGVEVDSFFAPYRAADLWTAGCPGGILHHLMQAYHSGYDGAAIGCFGDPGLFEAREMTDFPVVGILETSMHLASILGGKFSGIAVGTKELPIIEERAHLYGMDKRFLPFIVNHYELSDLCSAFDRPGPVLEIFSKSAQILVDAGAEVIIPACGFLNLLLARCGIREFHGALILDGIAVALKFTEMLIDLSRSIGLKVSRRLLFAAPSPEEKEAMLKGYGMFLQKV